MDWSTYQKNIFAFVEKGAGSAIVEAVAGAGKTTTLVEAVSRLKGSAYLAAFNKRIGEELQARISGLPWKEAGTFHSAGFRALVNAAPKGTYTVEGRKCSNLWEDYCEHKDKREWLALTSVVCRLVAAAKQNLLGLENPIEEAGLWEAWIEHFGLLDDAPEGTTADALVGHAQTLLHLSLDETKVIDFDDMLYLPLLHHLRPMKYDTVLIDECCIGDTPVLLDKGGRWETIQSLVERGYRGMVLSYNGMETVAARVIGHKKVLREKPLKQIRFVAKHPTWALRTRKVSLGVPIVVCTEDHRIKTARGWVSAKDLRVGETVYMETAQGRVGSYQQRHKISADGKQRLAPTGNRRGVGNPGGRLTTRMRGGNGRTAPTELLFRQKMEGRLPGLVHGGVIATGQRTRGGLPTHYKVDFMMEEQALVIEIDGGSHSRRRAEDARKEDFLSRAGYAVIRFTNREVQRLLPQEMLARITPQCFVEAEVVEVNDYSPSDASYVYDLEVEGTHCYFAHGLLVHNCQDTNKARLYLARAMCKTGGRVIAVGDPKQAIYGFAGASATALDQIEEMFDATRLPLSVSYRCAQEVVRHAKQWQPAIAAWEQAPVGKVSQGELAELLTVWKPAVGEALLCRFNRPLMRLAFALIRKGIPARIEGKEIGEGLVALTRKWHVEGLEDLRGRVGGWASREARKCFAKKNPAKAQLVLDKAETMGVLIERAEQLHLNVEGLQRLIREMFQDSEQANKRIFTLSSIHKAKGLEWGRVLHLGRGEVVPSPYATQAWEVEQEHNLMYVATTRAKLELVELAGVEEELLGEEERDAKLS